jgi:hypothetical protein
MRKMFYWRSKPNFIKQLLHYKTLIPPISDNKDNKDTTENLDLVNFGVTRRHYLLLLEWISAHTDKSIVGKEDAMSLLPCFGMSTEAFNMIKHAKQLYENSKRAKPVENRLFAIREQCPYSYSLLVCFAHLWIRHTEISQIVLPAFLVEKQVLAVKSRIIRDKSINLDDVPIPYEFLSIYLCPVCYHIYGMYYDIDSPPEMSKLPTGYNKMMMDFLTMRPYCDHVSVIAHQHFLNVPLRRISLLGVMLRVKDRWFTICPRKGCGVPCVIIPNKSIYDEDGYICSVCTRKQLSLC